MPPARQKKAPPARKPYHHGELVQALVREATAVVERDGHEAVSVREVARAVGVSPAAPFRHFRDRDELLRAVAFAARLRFVSLVERAIEDAGEDPTSQFRALGLAHVRFAIRHPHLQRLLQLPAMRKPPATASEEDIARVHGLGSRTSGLVPSGQSRGTMRRGDPRVLELAGVALAYGLTQLFLEGHLPKEGAEQLAESVIDVLGTGFQGDGRA